RRKTAVREGKAVAPAPIPAQEAVPADVGTQTGAEAPESSPALPPVESLTAESDFTPFMQPGVDPGLKREALKALLGDPRFNVMDGLDVYIDDYSKPDPMPVEWLEKLNQMKRLGEYLEPTVSEAPEDPGQGSDETGKAMQEQPVAFPEN